MKEPGGIYNALKSLYSPRGSLVFASLLFIATGLLTCRNSIRYGIKAIYKFDTNGDDRTDFMVEVPAGSRIFLDTDGDGFFDKMGYYGRVYELRDPNLHRDTQERKKERSFNTDLI